MNYKLATSIILLICFNINFLDAKTIKIGLGSCLDQDYPQPIWDSIEKEGLDYFIFLGDNVYGDSPNGSLRKMEQAYQKQNLMLPTFLDDITIFSIWDDHDYGVNDGGNEYKYKKESEAMFLDFWGIDKKDVRYSREGLYFAKNIECLTLFSTHFFEITLLAKHHPYIHNFHLSAAEHENELIFLYQLLPGAATKSYGLWVAKLAGIPEQMIQDATQILKSLESSKPLNTLKPDKLAMLDQINLSKTSPKQALQLLYQLKQTGLDLALED